MTRKNLAPKNTVEVVFNSLIREFGRAASSRLLCLAVAEKVSLIETMRAGGAGADDSKILAMQNAVAAELKALHSFPHNAGGRVVIVIGRDDVTI
jgi:hypothetical protein